MFTSELNYSYDRYRPYYYIPLSFFADFILSYMYLIVETIVLPGEPNNFFLSPTIVAVFNVILGLQVSFDQSHQRSQCQHACMSSTIS